MPGELRQRISEWFGSVLPGYPHASGRWVVLDCETTGLNPESDQLLSIGAIGVRDGTIDLSDSFEIILRPDRPSAHDNVQIHGIGIGGQMAGVAPLAALLEFTRFVADDPLLAFHAPFDRAFINKALGASGIRARFRWLDVAALAVAAMPGHKANSLDDWLDVLRIPVFRRHHAVGDALATAMLFLAIRARAGSAGKDLKSLTRLARQARWLGTASSGA